MGEHGHLAVEGPAPLPLEPAADGAPRDDFASRELALFWNFLRNPTCALYSLDERPGYLRLRGSEHGLDDVASPAWVGRRQGHFAVRVAVCLEFEPASLREEAGLVVRMNEGHHYEIFVTRRADRPSVVLRRRIGSLQSEVACRTLSPAEISRVVLAVDADPTCYVFSCGPSEDDLQRLGEGETRYLSTEVAGGFTGVCFAMYASGNGSPCRRPADFDWFDYRERGDAPAVAAP